MEIYIDPILITLYVLATICVVWYITGCTWIKSWARFTPREVDLSFEVTSPKHKQMILAILEYLNTHKSQFVLKRSFRKDINIPFREVIALIDRNEINKFRIESINTTTLFIDITCEYSSLKFRCSCDKEVFDSLLRIMRNCK